jgi:hypothetical protein
MCRIVVVFVCLFAAVAFAPTLAEGQPPGGFGGPAPGAKAVSSEQFAVIRLAPSAKPSHVRALKYQLYPDALDLTPGNAATIWMRAGDQTKNAGTRE